jgi:RNA recognition motif-containing protein
LNSQKQSVPAKHHNVIPSDFNPLGGNTLKTPGFPSLPVLRRKTRDFKDIDEALNRHSRNALTFGGRSRYNEERDIEKIIKSNLRFQSKVTKSAVVLVSNLNCSQFCVENMYNLASASGNIKRLLMMRNLNKCLIEFTSTDFAQVCITMLNNQFFLGEKLKVNFSKYSKIDLRKNGRSGNSEKYNQVKKVSRKEWRYPSKKKVSNITFISPSVYLLMKISQNKEGTLSHENVFQRVKKEKFGPSQIKLVENKMAGLLMKEYYERNIWKAPKQESSYLLSIYKFKNLQESMYMLAKLHGASVEDRKLEVFFSFFKF